MTPQPTISHLDVQQELSLMEEKGNIAIENGKLDECLDWYLKGLRRAKELDYRNEIRKFSLLVATII